MTPHISHRVPNAPRDPHAETLPAVRGDDRVTTPRRVAVIGGGIAGLAAATGLAERGVDVTVYESQPQLGGRVRSWPTDDGRNMSRGFHAFFRQYYNLRALLRRTDPALDRLTPVADYPLQTDTGLTDSFARIPRTPPANLAAFVLQSPTFPLAGLTQVDLSSALELIDLEFPASLARYDGESAAAFLDRLQFPDGARHLALEVFARSFFADPQDFAARELVTMFHTYFTGSAEGLLFDVPVDDFNTALWDPLGDYLRDLGATIHLNTPVTGLVQARNWTVASALGEQACDAVVLAAAPRASRELIARLEAPDTPGLAALQDRARRRRNAPAFAVLRMWLSDTVHPDRVAFLGTSGYRLLDNISVLERYETTAAQWTATHGGSVVELHAYAVNAPADPSSAAGQAVREALLADMHQVFPETRTMDVVAEEYLLEDDCGLADVSPWQDHPEVNSGVDGLLIAGDWIRAPLPVALMERAATTGLLAANALLADWGVTGHDLISPPRTGLLRRTRLGRSLRALAVPGGSR